jgi:hypothetical protein
MNLLEALAVLLIGLEVVGSQIIVRPTPRRIVSGND